MMAQVGHIEPLGIPPSSGPASKNQSPSDVDMLPITAILSTVAPCRMDAHQIGSIIEGIQTENPAVEDDDDVQIVFCAPRRKKKRRRRLESTHSVSPLSQVSKPPADEHLPPNPCNMLPQDLPRRRSTGVVHQLESCHLDDEKSTSVRAGSLPSIPCATSNAPSAQYPWFAEPNYCGTWSHFPSLADSTAWWEQSLPTLQPRPFPSIPWRPLQLEDPESKKRKHDEDLNETVTQPTQLRQSVQTPPRTQPIPTESLPEFHPYHISGSYSNPYGSCNHTSPTGMCWPNNGWNSFENMNPNQYGSQSPQQAPMPMDKSGSDIMYSSNMPQRQSPMGNEYRQRESSGTWHQSNETTSQQRNQSSVTSVRALQPLPLPQGQIFQRLPSPGVLMPSNPHASLSHASPIALNDINISRAPTPIATQSLGVQAHSTRLSAPPVSPRANIMTVSSSDISRKPSLYSIPAWPADTSPTMPRVLSATIRSQVECPISDLNDCNGGKNEVIKPTATCDGSSQPASVMRAQRVESGTQPHGLGTVPAKASSPASPQPNAGGFQIPNARLGRKHSPNLIVDIAETCQDMFPFAAVAERHEVPIQKVFDTFSAIIQLPLLRNADDRRRHGSLGKRRTKEYRDAKKAMEKAQETERKAQMKAMRARAEHAASGKEQGKTQGFLKSALLSNAREAQGAV